MNKELEKQLYKKYPDQFTETKLDEMQSCMAFGICFGEGWLPLFEKLCAHIDNHIKWKKGSSGEVIEFRWTQLKEKFGSGRFYYYGGDDYIEGMIALAESLTYITCEDCGNVAKERNDHGWYSTLCNQCWSKLQERKKEKN